MELRATADSHGRSIVGSQSARDRVNRSMLTHTMHTYMCTIVNVRKNSQPWGEEDRPSHTKSINPQGAKPKKRKTGPRHTMSIILKASRQLSRAASHTETVSRKEEKTYSTHPSLSSCQQSAEVAVTQHLYSINEG